MMIESVKCLSDSGVNPFFLFYFKFKNLEASQNHVILQYCVTNVIAR